MKMEHRFGTTQTAQNQRVSDFQNAPGYQVEYSLKETIKIKNKQSVLLFLILISGKMPPFFSPNSK